MSTFPLLGLHWRQGRLTARWFAHDAQKLCLNLYEEHALRSRSRAPLWRSYDLTFAKHVAGGWWTLDVPWNYSPELQFAYALYLEQSHPEGGLTHRWLLDPYARAALGGDEWGRLERFTIHEPSGTIHKTTLSALPPSPQHPPRALRRLGLLRHQSGGPPVWQRPQISKEDAVVYECHVRGMTQHASSGVPDAERGTFRGLCSKIPELKKLGVNVVELLPIFDFDENENRNTHPATGDRLYNYWGYSPLLWFAPKASYASVPARATQEFQEFVQACHAEGLEVWLDVVYNHTAELDAAGPIDHFKALSPHETYLHTPEGHLRNDSGCGNTLRCRHPLTREWVIESLRYWHHELGIDGFRFDLTTILNRDPQSGEVADFPTLLWELREDPTFAAAKWIAEPWDAAGGYQLGHYAFHADWLEWNDRYRDEMRRVLCGMPNQAQAFQRCIEGSPHIYGDRAAGAQNSLNFLTAHDGFTLMDLFSYREKHNAANGEGNRDGHPENFSDNGGVEGPTADPQVLAWREQKWRLAFALLAVSNGPMMFVSGDEWGRSQQGNNNAYCQDNELNWLRWDEAEQSSRRVDYVQQLLQLRNKCRSLWWSPQTKVDWFSSAGGEADWGTHVRSFVWRLRPPDPDEPPFWFCCNAFDAALPFQLPVASLDGLWHSSEFLHVDWPAPTEQTWLIPAWTLWIGRESHPTANTP